MLPATVLFDFLRKDFARAWDAMALTGFDRDVGGNFMFARQAMVLLELASRVGRADARLADFSAGIERVDPLYFWPLPGGKKWPSFGLPSSKVGGDRRSQLLPVLFDLVRHGQLHNGVQIPVRLGDGKIFGVALGGVEPGVTLDSLRREPSPMAQERPPDHLAFCKRQGGHFELLISPGRLFVDLEGAAERAGVFTTKTNFTGDAPREWDATSAEFEASIRSSGALIAEEQERLR